MFICHLYICFGEVSVKVLTRFIIGLFVFLLLSFNSSLYIMDNSPLSDKYFRNIFSYSVTCLLNLLIVSVAEKRLLLMKSNLFFSSWVMLLVLHLKSPHQT